MYDANKHELEILKFWKDDHTFEKSISERPEDRPYVFYDGPPFATGLPHYGHLMAGTKKDVIPRYFTMRGYRVERRWGWDCHGLPIENLIEKELGLSGPKEIEEYGIDRFNEACRSKVFTYADEWKKVVPRFGRWIDMDNPYITMSLEFMESVWWVFGELYKKGLVYEGKRPMHICPRCVTPLSNFEVSQGYKDVKDLSVTAKFRVTDGFGDYDNLNILAWTTTPWTLPGNVLLAVGEDIDYTIFRADEEVFVVAKELLDDVVPPDMEFEVLQQVKGRDLVGLRYEPLFPYFTHLEGVEHAFRVVTADFVTTSEGTGIVHIAPGFGTDDYEVFRREGVPFIQHVNMDGTFVPEVTDFQGMHVKPIGDHTSTDVAIIKYLVNHGTLFSKKKYEHSYPHCWRCDTPLLNYSTNSWFVEVTKLRDDLIANNKQIHWIPEHIKEGRFGKWLESVRDWSISRNRYWGTPIPVWKSDDGDTIVVSSRDELEELTGEKVDDLHKHKIDHLTIEKNGKTYTRIPDVLDTWFDSGSVPYGQAHYPFENRDTFEAGFPADFIAESQDQTRGWFYTLHVLATALTSGDDPSIRVLGGSSGAFRTVSVNGIVLAEDGQKMSKRLKNYPDPMDMVEKYGADAVRYYMLAAPVMHGESMNFSEDGLREVYSKVVNTLSNVLSFYELFASEIRADDMESDHVLDRWVVARVRSLVRDVETNMEQYRIAEATRPIMDFVLDLSQWYVRRSRDRFKGEDETDRQAAYTTLRHVLEVLAKVMAPFTPFVAERVWQVLGHDGSVHLEFWPEMNDLDEAVLVDMVNARKVVEMGLSLRKESGVKVRQPLSRFAIIGSSFSDELHEIIASELNVKEITDVPEDGWIEKEDGDIRVALDTEITPELAKEGLLREIVRAINQLRKEEDLTRGEWAVIAYSTDDEDIRAVFKDFGDDIKKQTYTSDFVEGGESEVKVNGNILKLSIN